ncbi:PAS domain S-box protein [Denitrificimonas sp. JX-1]|uniref:histidine kinase n=1 Tax=Denitrificimonas halotolerans TaxID=3098930 RepID=A0ABU5GRP2_9GAMM|nr:PAS domain S-box protein [Denitrificimonas sp. JX-1]MDY7219267.1 PAS domain S-box protein [Denitrificimonas sp. JX-1]
MQRRDNQALHLRLLQRLLREKRPLVDCAAALQKVLQLDSNVRAVWYFTWQASAGIYSPIGDGQGWPPGPDDLTEASDQKLFHAMQQQTQLSLKEVAVMDCWLAKRIQRSGLSKGVVARLSLYPGQQGLIAVELQPEAPLYALDSLLNILSLQLACTQPAAPVELLSNDPNPVLWVNRHSDLVEVNQAVIDLFGHQIVECAMQALPNNHVHLVRSCLQQQRVVEDVPAHFAQSVYMWTYIPDVQQQHVLVRGRDVTEQAHRLQDAAQASRLYRLITENTTDLISRHRPDGRFISASPASWQLLGYWPEELQGMRYQDLLHEKGVLLVEQNAINALIEDGYHTMTLRMRHRDGHFLWFETASRAIRETYTGDIVEIISVSRDITERVQSEENRRRLAEVVEVNTDLVLFVDPSGLVRWMNPSARRALQVEIQHPCVQLDEIVDPATLRVLDEKGWKEVDQQGVWSCEARFQPYAGLASFPVSLVLLAHTTAGGEYYYSFVARNMAERELREAQHRKHQEELAHTARLVTLGELTSGIAHEMNQPLASVINYASASLRYLQAADMTSLPIQRVVQGLQRITEHANHAAQVIKRLRAFLRKEPRRVEGLNLAEVLQDATQLCAWEARNAQVYIEQQLLTALPVIYADRVLLEQVLLNILRNAIEANREQHQRGQKASRILMTAEQRNDSVYIQVHDQGAGVSQEQMEHMFTPFYTSKAEGLGLGLSMSRSIVEGFGGALEAEAGALGGLCLSCRLPIRACNDERITVET